MRFTLKRRPIWLLLLALLFIASFTLAVFLYSRKSLEEKYEQIEIGMTYGEVEAILGPPARERTSLLARWINSGTDWLETRTINGCCLYLDHDWSDGRKVVRVTFGYNLNSGETGRARYKEIHDAPPRS